MTDKTMTPAEVLAVMETAATWLPCDEDSEGEQIETRFDAAIMEVRSAFSELEARQWRGMESAPKDGTEVLLHKEGRRYVARWIHSEAMGPVWATPDGHVIFRATEWTTLPTPPQEPV